MANLSFMKPKFKIGDTIQWTFPENHRSIWKGKTFHAKVAMVDVDDKVYGVYVKYGGGQDLIPFDQAEEYKPE
tara:strand:- start:2160 stop:2378 length:219 start_codon:yes stop_codon:yes gene_type:complete